MGSRLKPDCPAVQICNLLTVRKPYTGTFIIIFIVKPLKNHEDAVVVFWVNTYAIVLYGKSVLVFLFCDRNVYLWGHIRF